MKNDLSSVVEHYLKTRSLEKTAAELKISTGTVRRFLLTAGLWKNKTSEEIAQVRDMHPFWSSLQIAKALNLSVKTVQMYSPYPTAEDSQKKAADGAEGGMQTAPDGRYRSSQRTPPEQTGQCGDTVWWRLFRDGLLEIVGSGPMKPGYSFSELRMKINRVLIGDDVTGIAAYAFAYSPFLSEVVFGRNTGEFGPRAFYHCAKLTKITVPDNSFDTGAQDEIFEGSPVLTVSVPETARTITPAILNIPSVMEFVCEASEESCTLGFFSDNGILYYRDTSSGVQTAMKCPCSKPLYQYRVLDGTTEIGHDCFNRYRMRQTLREVWIPDSVIEVGFAAFFENTILHSVILPDSVVRIAQAAFYRCSSLERAELGSGLREIGITAFRLCTSLKDVVIPEKVRIIGDEAFAICDQLGSPVFLGDAPELEEHDYYREGIFGKRDERFRIRYRAGTRGWTDPWMGYRTEEI